jgi:hypothetical protein
MYRWYVLKVWARYYSHAAHIYLPLNPVPVAISIPVSIPDSCRHFPNASLCKIILIQHYSFVSYRSCVPAGSYHPQLTPVHNLSHHPTSGCLVCCAHMLDDSD